MEVAAWWYENGRKRKTGTKLDGLLITWDENGEEIYRRAYKNGKGFRQPLFADPIITIFSYFIFIFKFVNFQNNKIRKNKPIELQIKKGFLTSFCSVLDKVFCYLIHILGQYIYTHYHSLRNNFSYQKKDT